MNSMQEERNSQQNQQENEHQSDKHLHPKIDSKESNGVIHSAHRSSTMNTIIKQKNKYFYILPT